METPKPKGIGQILWESIELWKDHLFPLVWVSLGLTIILVIVYWAISLLLPSLLPQEEMSLNFVQGLIAFLLPVLILTAFTATMDVLIWSYFQGISIKELFSKYSSLVTKRLLRLFTLDLIVLGGITAFIFMFMLVIGFASKQQWAILVLLLSVVLILILIVLFAVVFVPYRFILRPKYAMEDIPFNQAWKESYQLFFQHSLKIIGLVFLTYLIVFLLTPRSATAWINQIPFVILGPYVSIVIWTFYTDLNNNFKKEDTELS